MSVVDIITIKFCCVTFNCNFFNSVFNFFAGFIFRQICKAVCPVSVVIRCYFLRIHFITVCKKVYNNFLRSDSILVVTVIPGLGTFDFSRLRFMSVGDVVTINRCFISFNCIFFYSISDFVASCIFRQIGKLIFPVVICGYFLAVNFGSICKEVHCDTCWTFAILVVIVGPGLGSVDGSCLWVVGVRDHISS